MAKVFEMLMLICFGLSWPFNIVKSVTPRTARGKSHPCEGSRRVGYLCGLAGKLISHNLTYVVVFYILDLMMVGTDLLLTLRNRGLDRQREKEAAQ